LPFVILLGVSTALAFNAFTGSNKIVPIGVNFVAFGKERLSCVSIELRHADVLMGENEQAAHNSAHAKRWRRTKASL
jgi:hypothetical protein